MTVLYNIADYQIITQKVDNCKPLWCPVAELVGFFGMICTAFIVIWGVATSNVNGIFYSLFLGVSSIFLTLIPSTRTGRLGVKITLVVSPNPNTITDYQAETTYILTGDLKKDARKIQEIVNRYTTIAQEKIEQRKRQNEKERITRKELERKNEQHRIQYKEVIGMVKQE